MGNINNVSKQGVEVEGNITRGIKQTQEGTKVKEFKNGTQRTYQNGKLVKEEKKEDATDIIFFLTE
jgi:hypothetical protein